MTIIPHDTDTCLVESRSRPGEHHIVDISEMTCSCEYFNDPSKHPITPTCAHLEAVLYRIHCNDN